MTVKLKICENCSKKVNAVAEKCPYCSSTSFHEDIGKSQDNITILDYIKYPLFYCEYNGVFIFSRAKFINVVAFIFIFIYFMRDTYEPLYSFIWVLVFFAPVYIVTHLAHAMAENESAIRTRIRNREDSLTLNIVHFMFYWHDEETNTYTFSKTKTVSLLIYIVFVLYRSYSSTSFLAEMFVGLFILIPALLAGSLIHYLLLERNNEKTPKEVKPPKPKKEVKEIKPQKPEKEEIKPVVFSNYSVRINDLAEKFSIKEQNVRDLIERRFPAPQITNTKFNAIIDEAARQFTQKAEITRTLIDSTPQYSAKIESEIKSNINILKEINNKLDKLSDELLISMSEDKNDEVKSVLGEIDEITDSLKDYDYG